MLICTIFLFRCSEIFDSRWSNIKRKLIVDLLSPKCIPFQVPCWHILSGRLLKTILKRSVILMLLNLKAKIFLWLLSNSVMGTWKKRKSFYKSQLPSDAYLFKSKSKSRRTSVGRFMVFTRRWLFYWKNTSSKQLPLCDSLISRYKLYIFKLQKKVLYLSSSTQSRTIFSAGYGKL